MQLIRGVTVRPWTGVFMLRNLKSPETYFQTAFRVQSPWTVEDEDGNPIILKRECYIFDFALDRALRQISDYSCRLNVNEDNPEKKVAEFIHFLPVLAYDGSAMKQVDAQDVLDIALSGTSATLLARRWESALLVNVDNDTLKRLLANQQAMDALMKIEGFRALNRDIETIINKSDHVRKARKEGDDPNESPEERQKRRNELSEEEKEFKSKRKEIQQKLIKFATRVPVFMYLTDYREKTLKDVITQLEPGLFKKVTGLDVKDFELLCSLGVFNASLMNDAIFKFKRYEDSSLTYTGITRHSETEIGGWDTVLTKAEYEKYFYHQQATMEAPAELTASAPVPADEPDEPAAAEPEPPARREKPVTEPAPARREKPVTEGAAEGRRPAAAVPRTVPRQRPLPADRTDETKRAEVSAVSVGTGVYHRKFGPGTVKSLTASRVTVRFADGEKTFVYPDIFRNGFLRTEA